MNILITGGAGFIGSRLALKLAAAGHVVTVLDTLSPQIHGTDATFAPALAAAAHCVQGSVCDKTLLAGLLGAQEAIVHLAAETGTGQSMYAVEHYSQVNLQGTAVLLDIIVNQRPANLRKLVVASSRATYGEGAYHCGQHGLVYPAARTAAALQAGQFEPTCPHCARPVEVRPTPESAPFAPSSFYGLTKQVQEQMVLLFAATLGIDGIALRYQNVYGPGQSLNNPYTGILAVFSNLARQGKTINIFEDGEESRDFVFVDDVVDATFACIKPEVRGVHALNVGSGVRTTVMQVAQAVVSHLKADVPVKVSGAFRLGDIRHNVADLTQLEQLTGFKPQVPFITGLHQFLDWALSQQADGGGYERSLAELRERGLMGTGRA
jgi:dTDP-L-rhamnose 4-epimerase